MFFRKKQISTEEKNIQSTDKKIRINDFCCITIGVSAGGTKALSGFLPMLPADFPLPIVIIQHLHPNQGLFFIEYFDNHCNLKVKCADEKETIKKGHVYFAPPNYHLLLEEDKTFSLSIDKRVNYSRPSIDVFFMSASDVFTSKLIGIVLTGANYDGALGLKAIKEAGGLAIVQNPDDAESKPMPSAAIKSTKTDYILPLKEIANLLVSSFHESQK